jgi:hypothetical protein
MPPADVKRKKPVFTHRTIREKKIDMAYKKCIT